MKGGQRGSAEVAKNTTPFPYFFQDSPPTIYVTSQLITFPQFTQLQFFDSLYVSSFLVLDIMSTSSEIVDSGRLSGKNMPSRAPQKSSFSQTCNLFSQYLKENATFPDLTLGRRTPSTATMNLFPMAETPLAAVQEKTTTGQNQSGPMTIFYNGQVIVFNDLAPEKVKEILMLAEKGVPQKTTKPDEVLNNIVHDSIKIQRPQPVASDLPIARKASLARFLEKRKDRITARSPYQIQGDSKQEDSKTWLGLGAQPHVQFHQRS